MSTRCQIEFYDAPQNGAELGEPAARLYKHSDGYPSNILVMLKQLEDILKVNIPSFGPRTDDPEWAAAEFITQFRVKSNARKLDTDNWRYEGEDRFATRGNVYVSHQIHGDIEYLYRVVCKPKWEITVFRPVYDDSPGFNIKAFEAIKPAELRKLAPSH